MENEDSGKGPEGENSIQVGATAHAKALGQGRAGWC